MRARRKSYNGIPLTQKVSYYNVYNMKPLKEVQDSPPRWPLCQVPARIQTWSPTSRSRTTVLDATLWSSWSPESENAIPFRCPFRTNSVFIHVLFLLVVVQTKTYIPAILQVNTPLDGLYAAPIFVIMLSNTIVAWFCTLAMSRDIVALNTWRRLPDFTSEKNVLIFMYNEPMNGLPVVGAAGRPKDISYFKSKSLSWSIFGRSKAREWSLFSGTRNSV